jgi:pSer/pThr/pTyr-binding forkhead associated (FHA) protein
VVRVGGGRPPGKDTDDVNATLVVIAPDGKRAEVPVAGGGVTVGRQRGCDVRIPMPSVSRSHCRIAIESGQPVLHDLGSSNGTYLNGKRVKDAPLSPGDVVGVGDVLLVLQVDGKPRDVDPAALRAQFAPSVRRPARGERGESTVDDDLLADLDLPDADGSSVSDFDFDELTKDKDEPRL